MNNLVLDVRTVEWIVEGGEPYPESQIHELAASHEALRVELENTRQALRDATELLMYLADIDDGPCRFDHHGYCQEHTGGFREGGCLIYVTKEWLERRALLGEVS